MTVKLVSDLKLGERSSTTLREAARGFIISLRASASHAPGSIGALENTLAMISYYAEENYRHEFLQIQHDVVPVGQELGREQQR